MPSLVAVWKSSSGIVGSLCHISYFTVYSIKIYYLFLQYFDTVGWVFWPVKTISNITYTVLVGTKNTAQSSPILGFGKIQSPWVEVEFRRPNLIVIGQFKIAGIKRFWEPWAWLLWVGTRQHATGRHTLSQSRATSRPGTERQYHDLWVLCPDRHPGFTWSSGGMYQRRAVVDEVKSVVAKHRQNRSIVVRSRSSSTSNSQQSTVRMLW